MKEFVVFLSFLPALMGTPIKPEWITWNVGQGLFQTLIENNKCLHIDFGGEFYPKKLNQMCSNKLNVFILSHEDKDHYSFIKKILKISSKNCYLKKYQLFEVLKIQECLENQKISVLFETNEFKNRNSNSTVYYYKDLLFPGDSTKQTEKLWHFKIPKNIKYWSVAHHGSSTSTSFDFLNSLPKNAIGIVSARKKKYGHPHKKVLERIKVKKNPILLTEDWGHIRIEF